MAISQFLPDVRIGYLCKLYRDYKSIRWYNSNYYFFGSDTYWGPLGFVLTVTICREAVDDIRYDKKKVFKIRN